MKSRIALAARAFAATAACFLIAACNDKAPLDEALTVGRGPETLAAADEDYFHDMDGGIHLDANEIKGRNTWIVWSGGNDRFWDGMTESTFGGFDLLKIVAYDPKRIDRDRRWNRIGLINEPCFEAPTQPDPKRYGL